MKLIILISCLLLQTVVFSQNIYRDSVYTVSQKDGSLGEPKKCILAYEDAHLVEFRLNSTSVKTFFKIDVNTWTTFNKKVVERQVLPNGWIAFIDNKKIYLYKKQ